MSDREDFKQHTLQAIDRRALDIRQAALAIHARPELACDEHFASQMIANQLEQAGFIVQKGMAGLPTSFVARRDGKLPGARVGIMAEYDALPEIGHACGHNLIAAAALGAALGLSAVMEQLPGTLLIYGTPGEEKGIGKVALLKDGWFAELDAALIAHPRNDTMLGRVFTALQFIEFTFIGKTSHAGSAPELGVNALDACIAAFNGVNALKKHLRPDSRINGIIVEGGVAPNLVPDRARAVFGVRANDQPYLETIAEKIKACAQGGALMSGARVETRVTLELADMLHNMTLAEAFGRHAAALGHHVLPVDPTGGGSTDLGSISRVVPSIHPFFKIGPSDLVLHTPEFAAAAVSNEAMESVIDAAKMLALTAIDIWLDERLLERARAEFEANTKPR